MSIKLRSRGFTITEMVVAAGICVLLASVLLPVLHSARERGRKTSCISNLKQLGTTFTMYADDNARRYPPSHSAIPVFIPNAPPHCPQIATARVTWKELIRRYIRSEGVFMCPSVKPKLDQRVSTWQIELWDHCPPPPPTTGGGNGSGGGGGGGGIPCPTPPPIIEPPTSYVYNQMIKHEDAWKNSGDFGTGHGFSVPRTVISKCSGGGEATRGDLKHNMTVSQSSITRPGEVIMLAESSKNGEAPIEVTVISDAELDYTQDKPKAPEDEVPSRIVISHHHTEGFNVVYADQHVKWIKYGSSKPAQWTVENDN